MSGSASISKAGVRARGTAATVTLLLKWRMLQAILLDRSLSPAAKAIAARLLDRYNTKTHQCNPSYQTLSEDTGYTRRQVIRAASELKQQGWISTSRGVSKLPSNEFDFAWLKITDEAPEKVQTDDTHVTSSEAKVIKLETPLSPPGDNSATLTGDFSAAKLVSDLSPKYGNLNREESGKGNFLTAADAAPTPAGALFSECRKYLERTTGMKPDSARAVVGGWRKNFADGEIIDAFSRAQRIEAQDPIAFIQGCLRHKRSGGDASVGAMSAISALERYR
ncbi:MAG: hypothetical protein QOK44_177 [Betaproteobacteria bacterium]|jgi:hypothetical protein|nr:hypothetical protein [Betaproteobacteria bacterium]